MAALIYEPKNQFFCGGNIITASHVLTAAHCVQNKKLERQLEASTIAVLLGRYNISLRAEFGSEIRGVKEIKVHPSWNPRYVKFEGDVAVLEMDRAVQFSELIQPVCLTVEPEISQREAGFVVIKYFSWLFVPKWSIFFTTGRLGKKRGISSARNCTTRGFDIFSDYWRLLRERFQTWHHFFAGNVLCWWWWSWTLQRGLRYSIKIQFFKIWILFHFSGGGFFVRYHGLWTLRGVVSSGSFRIDGGCDAGRYALFSNVLDYTSWINDVAKNNVSQSKQESSITT